MASRGGGLRSRNAMDRVLGSGGERSLEGNWFQRAIRPQYQAILSQTRNSEGDEGIRMRLLRAGFPYGMNVSDFKFMKKALSIALPIVAGYKKYLDWIDDSTR